MCLIGHRGTITQKAALSLVERGMLASLCAGTSHRLQQKRLKHPSLCLWAYTWCGGAETLETNCTLTEQPHGAAGIVPLSVTNNSLPHLL